ncbi:efflux RND transporter periplasmic adaptor subunit, partial [Klebsiella michiganensis]|uniref:efflux RND transporter periplasmic adaptor subunit n=1 Tax=Klebsiella michiganensis TaxID=1134687 RepID=UPI0013CFF099
FSIVATDHVWIQASPKETELTYVRPGQPATLSVDTYPGVVWRGTVESISPASGASFSLLPAQNTTGNWVKVVQRIP